jgi:hypothetical protein
MIDNLPDDWEAHYHTCDVCGKMYHLSGAEDCDCGRFDGTRNPKGDPYVWTDKHGRHHLIPDIPADYLQNILNFVADRLEVTPREQAKVLVYIGALKGCTVPKAVKEKANA